MSLTKASGQMYPWISHMHSHLGGVCPHKCSYCYAQDIENRWHSGRYAGELRLIESELSVKYGKGKTIFIEHMNDILADGVTQQMVKRIIDHCLQWPDNTYVFQSKNPIRFNDFVWPENSIFGTTIETNIEDPYKKQSQAPWRVDRAKAMKGLPFKRKFVTIEPVMNFDVEILARWIGEINPEFLNLGADSKGHGLPEPSVEKIMQFAEELKKYGVELREKHNLQRLKQKG